jgi:hypothetical protein
MKPTRRERDTRKRCPSPVASAATRCTLDEIRERFGPDGVTDLALAYGRVGAIAATRR